MTPYDAVLIHSHSVWPLPVPLRLLPGMAWYHLAVISAFVFVIGVVAYWSVAK